MELVKKAVAETEKMSISDDEYKEKLPEFLENYGYETEEDLLAVLTKDQIKEELLLQKAQDFIIDQAVVK
jgi:trigger factor